jgi:ABC-type proline/glycine betaine transport system ATPase subunit
MLSLPNMTVTQNVAFPLHMAGVRSGDHRPAALRRRWRSCAALRTCEEVAFADVRRAAAAGGDCARPSS